MTIFDFVIIISASKKVDCYFKSRISLLVYKVYATASQEARSAILIEFIDGIRNVNFDRSLCTDLQNLITRSQSKKVNQSTYSTRRAHGDQRYDQYNEIKTNLNHSFYKQDTYN